MDIFLSLLGILYMLHDHLSHDYTIYEKNIRKSFLSVGAVVLWNSFSMRSWGKYKPKPEWPEGRA